MVILANSDRLVFRIISVLFIHLLMMTFGSLFSDEKSTQFALVCLCVSFLYLAYVLVCLRVSLDYYFYLCVSFALVVFTSFPW